jgi:beta-glucosidase
MTPATARDVAPLLLPAVRWDAAHGFAPARPAIEEALRLGVGGFIFFGGPAPAVAELTAELRRRSAVPLLLGADLERGAGQQFEGLTGLPPLAAVASLGDVYSVRRAAALTAREARMVGMNWDYAPVCDLDVEPENPIIGTRALGGEPERVAELATAWIDACQREGVLACAKHFPGHGRTRGDSHMELPVVEASAELLYATDLVPFRAAIDGGVASVMSAHVAYPALDPGGLPATRSRAILTDLLRRELGFDGLVVTDALIMDGALVGGGETVAAVEALDAGCDLLLYPTDLGAVADAVARALRDGRLDAERVRASLARRARWAEWAARPGEEATPTPLPEDVAWAAELADRVVHPLVGRLPRLAGGVDILVVDDDLGGPYPAPSREPFVAALRQGDAAMDVRVVERLSPDARGPVIVALFGDIRSWKGRPGYSAAARQAVAHAVDAARRAARDVVVVQFSHPRLAAELPDVPALLCAWGGEAPMQRAAARRLLRE